MKKLFGVLGCLFYLSLSITPAVSAETYPDPLELGSSTYQKVFENEKVRVSEIRFNPGDEIAMHTHSFDHFVYVLDAGTLVLSYPDGKTVEIQGAAGQVIWVPKESHAAKNTGETRFRALVVELKEPKAAQ